MKARLPAGEERFRASVEALEDGYAILSPVYERSRNGRQEPEGLMIDFRYEFVNAAGCRLNRRRPEEHTGRTMLELFPELHGLVEKLARVMKSGLPFIDESLHYAVENEEPGTRKSFYDLRAVKSGNEITVLWRDVTERMQAKEAEKEQRLLAETLRDIATILNGSLRREEVMDRILAQLQRVVPHDTVNLMLIEADVAYVVRCSGYLERGLAEPSFAHRLVVSKTKNLAWMVEAGKPYAIPDTHKSPEWVNLPGSSWIRSYAGSPLKVRGDAVGFLNVNSSTPNLYTAEIADRLQSFAELAALAIDNARLFYELQQIANTDELTGLYNRRGLVELGRQEIERYFRYGRPFSVLMLDLDHFKQINDQSGHLAGDQVLQQVAQRLRQTMRKTDVLGRFGGEEFLILLPETSTSLATHVAERIRQQICEAPYETDHGVFDLTVSIGVASVNPALTDFDRLILYADAALYQAKQAGRNRTYVMEEGEGG